MEIDPREVYELIAKEKIRTVLATYCRALDRCDSELLRSVYHEDAIDDHGVVSGSAREFVEFLVPYNRETFEETTHLIANNIIEFSGPDIAHSESYLLAWGRVKKDKAGLEAFFGKTYVDFNVPPPTGHFGDGSHYMLFAGRYIDRMERRNGAWRIASRIVVGDWNLNGLASSIWDEGSHSHVTIRGRKDHDDPAYSGNGPRRGEY